MAIPRVTSLSMAIRCNRRTPNATPLFSYTGAFLISPLPIESSYMPKNTPLCITLVQANSPDFQLIERFKSGESSAFDLLYHRHRDRVHGVILSVVYNPEDALDLTQEVFLKAYQGLRHFKRASQFYSWLYRIAINHCIEHISRQSKHRVLSDEPFSDEVFCYEPVHP